MIDVYWRSVLPRSLNCTDATNAAPNQQSLEISGAPNQNGERSCHRICGCTALNTQGPKVAQGNQGISSSIISKFPAFHNFKHFQAIHSVQLIVPIQAEVAVWIGFSFPAWDNASWRSIFAAMTWWAPMEVGVDRNQSPGSSNKGHGYCHCTITINYYWSTSEVSEYFHCTLNISLLRKCAMRSTVGIQLESNHVSCLIPVICFYVVTLPSRTLRA